MFGSTTVLEQIVAKEGYKPNTKAVGERYKDREVKKENRSSDTNKGMTRSKARPEVLV